MNCDVGKATEGSSYDAGEVTESLENEQSSFSNPSVASPTPQALHLASRPWIRVVFSFGICLFHHHLRTAGWMLVTLGIHNLHIPE